MKKKIIEIVGWYGVVAVVLAYLLNSFGYVTSGSLVYFWLNFSGAIAIMIDAWSDGNTQPVVLNIIWAVIAVVSLL